MAIKFRPGDHISIPETGYPSSIGIIESITGSKAVVRFKLGPNCRKKHRHKSHDWAKKTVDTLDIELRG